GHDRQKQRDGHREEGGGDREYGRHLHRIHVVRIGDDAPEIVEPHETRAQAERILLEHGLVEGLARRPVEEDERYGQLRNEQQIGEDPVRKDDARGQGSSPALPFSGRAKPARQLPSASLIAALPRLTALSSACWAVCWPASIF